MSRNGKSAEEVSGGCIVREKIREKLSNFKRGIKFEWDGEGARVVSKGRKERGEFGAKL